jgi:ABC-2 type transport system permease protein
MMKIKASFVRLLALAEKEWIQLRRDVRSLILSLVLPVFLVLIFGYALTMDVKHVSMAVLDQDKTSFSRNFLEKFSHTEYLSIKKYLENEKEIDALINEGRITMALVIPSGFHNRFLSGRNADVQLVVDGSDSTSATVAIGYIKSIIFEWNKNLKEKGLRSIGIHDTQPPVDVRNRIWYNSELKSKNFIVPGIIVIVMAIISALITSLTISREWERGTMETLITTPVRRFEVFFGKLIPYVFIALFDVVLTVAIGYFVFEVPLRGYFFELYLVAFLFLVGNSSLGILISSGTKSQVLSVQLAIILTYMPSIILSGYIFPVKNMPLFVQGVTYLIPAKYLIIYMKGVALKGVGFTVLWAQIVFLFLFALVVGIISLKNLELRLPEKN